MKACSICSHPERSRAELLIATGASIRSVARKFQIPYDRLWRHWRHTPPERKAALALGPVQRAALAARVSEESESVLDHYMAIRAGLYALYDAAVEAGDRSGGALLAGRLIEVCNAVGKLTHQLAATPLVMNQQNIYLTAEFSELQAALVRVLAPFPEARAAVIGAFRQLEARIASPPMIEARRETQAAF